MAEHRKNPIEVDEPQQKRRIPSWVCGLLAGEFFFGIALLGIFLFDKSTPFLPIPEWFLDLEVIERVRIICGLLAFPIMLGGWMFIWGDSPPFDWFFGTAFNITVGVILYGLIGALLGRWIGKLRHR